MKTARNMRLDSSSDSEHSHTGFEISASSSEDSDSQSENGTQDRRNQKISKKRKCIKVSDSDNSSEETSLIVSTSKKSRKSSPEKIPDHSELRKTSDVSSGDETKERLATVVKGKKKTSDISSGDETEKRSEIPQKGNRLQSMGSDSDDDDFSTKLNKSIRNGEVKENRNEVQKQDMQEEDASNAEEELNSAGSSAEELNSEQEPTEKTRKPSWSDSSDDSLNTGENSVSVSQMDRLDSDESDSAEIFTSPDMPEASKKGKRKSGGNKIKKDSGNGKTTDPKIERLKKYLRVAGLRVRSYQKLWEGCRTKKAKVEKLLQMLSDAGLKGKPTLQKCKKLQAKRERKEEVESLDVGNIITSDKGRPKRNAASLYLNPHATAAGIKTLGKKNVHTFSRIKSFVDSEGSD